MPNGGNDPHYHSDMMYIYTVKPMEERFVRIRSLVEKLQSPDLYSSEYIIQEILDALGDHGYPPEWNREKQKRKAKEQEESHDRSEFERLKDKYGWK